MQQKTITKVVLFWKVTKRWVQKGKFKNMNGKSVGHYLLLSCSFGAASTMSLHSIWESEIPGFSKRTLLTTESPKIRRILPRICSTDGFSSDLSESPLLCRSEFSLNIGGCTLFSRFPQIPFSKIIPLSGFWSKFGSEIDSRRPLWSANDRAAGTCSPRCMGADENREIGGCKPGGGEIFPGTLSVLPFLLVSISCSSMFPL